jgi:hypothetical protein
MNCVCSRLELIEGRYDKLKSLQEVAMGQHSSDPNESLLPLLLAFAQLEGTYDQREKEQMFRLIGVVTDAHSPAGALARRRDRR